MTKMLIDAVESNCPGVMKPRKLKVQPARPARAADRLKISTRVTAVRTPAEEAKGSESRIASRTG